MKIDDLTNDDWAQVRPDRLQRFARIVTRRAGRWLFRYRGYGRERIPATRGFIIAPNHGSYADPFFFLHGHRTPGALPREVSGARVARPRSRHSLGWGLPHQPAGRNRPRRTRYLSLRAPTPATA